MQTSLSGRQFETGAAYIIQWCLAVAEASCPCRALWEGPVHDHGDRVIAVIVIIVHLIQGRRPL